MSQPEEFRDFVLNHQFDQLAKGQDGRAIIFLEEDEYQAMQSIMAEAASPGSLNAALELLADIRAAAGDPDGKMMQTELVQHIAEIRERAARTQPEPSSGVPEKAREAARRAIELCHGDVLDEYPEVARAHIKGLANLILTAAPTPEAGQSRRAVAFGSGDKTVEVGTYYDKPAVFVAPAEPEGIPGELAPPTTGDDKHRLVPGEWLMTFPTEEQAHEVADALCGRPLKKLNVKTPMASKHAKETAHQMREIANSLCRGYAIEPTDSDAVKALDDAAKLLTHPHTNQTDSGAGDGWKPHRYHPEIGKPVLGHHRDWIDPDFCEDGIRECFTFGDGTEWQSARWDGYSDQWIVEDGAPELWHPRPQPPQESE